ncbi:MAG: DUF1795 domain-containing protein [Helicobacteraceae bacterium]|jgi:hypothetical protein|nr:DUF1795 domain-containing protein [Helicobacteraceae bacterium]
MKRAFAALICFAAIASFGASATVDCAKRYTEEGVFSVCPPTGWELRSIMGVKYKLFIEAEKDGASANINFIEESFDGSLKDYVDLNLKALPNAFDDFKLIKREKFSSKNVKGERLVIENTQFGLALRQTLYIFELKGSTKMVIACTATAPRSAAYVSIFEDMINSFQKL